MRTDDFFDLTVKLEGGFSDKKSDNGGKTKYGVTQTTLNTYQKRHNLPAADVKNLTEDEAKDIYLEFYYLPVKPYPDEEIHFNFIDMAYNSGHKHYLELKKAMGDSPIADDIYEWRTNYFENLNQPENIKGWLNRLDTIKEYFKSV